MLLSDPPASGTVTIDSGKTLDISSASAATVNFTNGSGTTGDLVLDSSKGFTGQIVGFSGDGTIANSDLIDLSDINIADVVTSKTTYTDNGNGTGTLTLYNANGQALDSINFVGQYQLANFTIENDGGGHTLIVDPPISNDPSGAGGRSVGGIPVQECGYAPSSTTAARVPSQMLTGFTFGDNFAFNFGASHNTLTDIHPDSDTLPVKFPNFANVLAGLSATHDDSHSMITVDSHDVMTLSDALKAQAHLHANDFHII